MQVFVLGMHRSGTSLLSRVMHELGLFVGESHELMPAQPCNVEGFWERVDVSRVNETLLELAGGSWDCPPSPMALQAAWSRSGSPDFEATLEKARGIVARLDLEGNWSIKDPRTSLTWPLWKQLVPSPRIFIAVRDPFEVAASLVARHSCTETLGLNLWQAYNEAILHFTHPEERTVVDYHSLLGDPRGETSRVASALGLSLPQDRIDNAARVASTALRTHRSVLTTRRLAEPRYFSLKRLYGTLLAEAGPNASGALHLSPWPLGHDVDAETAHARWNALPQGWSTPEPHGVWSVGTRASIVIGPLLAIGQNAPLRLRMCVRPFLGLACTRQIIRVTCEGETVLEAELRDPSVQEIEFGVPRRANTEHLTLRLALPNACSPANVGVGPDVRALGVLLSKVRVDALDPPLSSEGSSAPSSEEQGQ